MSTDEHVKKQFIAGTVCPACEAMDTIRLWRVDEVPHRDCVNCGFTDKLNAQGNSVALELPTRVTQQAKQPVKQGKTMQFFPNPKLKSNAGESQ